MGISRCSQLFAAFFAAPALNHRIALAMRTGVARVVGCEGRVVALREVMTGLSVRAAGG
ncbi:hypothetical protein [Streptomyces sp. MJP52]|uniref:hypothetical protein n=1 Tax=Streptomyces sp. MJP52 TaxID=2940555 RepID=UPI002474EF88|nr:hypothetical protein [Streptomyces sp. MJP52]MDH6223054.1 hypothetical protein [Streptomyces sp. MJP52]